MSVRYCSKPALLLLLFNTTVTAIYVRCWLKCHHPVCEYKQQTSMLECLEEEAIKFFFSYVYSSPAYSLTSTITALATAIRKEHDQPKTPKSIKVIRSADPHDMVISRVAKIN